MILLSIVGYGLLFTVLNSENQKKIHIGFSGLCGIFLLIIYAYVSNLFIPHTKIHNSIILLLGLISFFFFLFKNLENKNFKNELIILFIIFIFLFISILIKKNHDDFPYYHFAYTYNLTQEPAIFGIGKLNHGFRTPSSIFYINSLFFIPLADYYFFNFIQLYILGFSNIILLKKIFFNELYYQKPKKEIDTVNYISLISLIFINIFFYRISEHGTDRSAQILIIILFILLIDFFQKKIIDKSDINYFYILFGLIISFKAFYFLYVIFLLPLFLFVLNKSNLINTFKFLFVNNYFFYFMIITFLVILSYFMNTGCLLYPLSFTCFDALDWSISKNQVYQMNNWYELWSKSGANPNFRVQNPEIYIKGFNWVENWIKSYFFNKVSDFIFGILFMILVIYIFFIKLKKKVITKKLDKYTKMSYILLIVIFFEWFYNHPALRYGGYCVIALLIFIPFSSYLNKLNIDFQKFNKIATILVMISGMVFEYRNINRVKSEMEIYHYRPILDVFYEIDDSYFNLHRIIQNNKNSRGPFGKSIF